VTDGDAVFTHNNLFDQQSDDLLLCLRVDILCPISKACKKVSQRMSKPQIGSLVFYFARQGFKFGLEPSFS
jgi:hypothetical protein